MQTGQVVSIHISPAAHSPMVSVEEVRAVPSKGLEGDRYHEGMGTWSDHPGGGREITLIEIEAIEALGRDYGIALDPGDARRNVVTRGVALNHLIGKDLRIGEVVVRAIRLCDPCRHLEKLSRPRVRAGLVHRGGLRTEIVTGGMLRAGDPIEILG